MTITSPAPLVSMRNITKRFGSNHVLKDVDLELLPGEVHALLGGNGAGKSTLMKILMGVHRPDTGSIEFQGTDIGGASITENLSRGIAMIYQELSLMPNLSVAENILIGHEPTTRFGRVRIRELHSAAQQLIDEYHFPLKASDPLETLGFAQRQQVEILKALARGARVLIMDEPTSSLTAPEQENLFSIIDTLRQQGIGVIFISHRMAEIFRISDRISVLKDGMVLGPLVTGSSDIEEVARLMARDMGGAAAGAVRSQAAPSGLEVLRVEGLNTQRKLRDVSFSVHAGEVVGVAGLVGSGRSTLAKALFGLIPETTGQLRIDNRRVNVHAPQQAIEAGLGLVPEDRRLEGLVLMHPISHNVTLASLCDLAARSLLARLQRSRETHIAQELVTRLNVKSDGVGQTVGELSGGNQQKVVLAKWLAARTRVLILDEPTAGVDMQSKLEIREVVRDLAASGACVLYISSEFDEVVAVSDRILVISDGRIRTEVTGRMTEEELQNVVQRQSQRTQPEIQA